MTLPAISASTRWRGSCCGIPHRRLYGGRRALRRSCLAGGSVLVALSGVRSRPVFLLPAVDSSQVVSPTWLKQYAAPCPGPRSLQVGRNRGVHTKETITRCASVSERQHTPARLNQTLSWITPLLVVVYICSDVSVYLVGERASQNYTKQALLFTSAFASVLIGSSVSVLQQGWKGLPKCFDVRSVLGLLPVSASFCLSMLSLLFSFRYFDSSFIKLLGQMKLPVAAFLSALILGRRYSFVQWQLFFFLAVACTSFTLLRIGSANFSFDFFGFWFVMAWVFFNVFATLFAERRLKTRSDVPFAALMTNIRIGELITSFLLLLFLPGVGLKDAFRGWDASTFAVLGTIVGDAWLSALMVKRLSSVTKIIAKCFSLVVLYSVALMTGKQPFVATQALGALMIVEATALFVFVSRERSADAPTEGVVAPPPTT